MTHKLGAQTEAAMAAIEERIEKAEAAGADDSYIAGATDALNFADIAAQSVPPESVRRANDVPLRSTSRCP